MFFGEPNFEILRYSPGLGFLTKTTEPSAIGYRYAALSAVSHEVEINDRVNAVEWFRYD
jgi:hypothetical protein